MDSVIAACAEAKGVEIVYGNFAQARRKLEGEAFDCLLLSSVLHLVEDPVAVLSSLRIACSGWNRFVTAPNFSQVTARWRSFRGAAHYRHLGDYAKTGMHATTPDDRSRMVPSLPSDCPAFCLCNS